MKGNSTGSRWVAGHCGGLCQVWGFTVALALLLLSILIKEEVLSSRQRSLRKLLAGAQLIFSGWLG